MTNLPAHDEGPSDRTAPAAAGPAPTPVGDVTAAPPPPAIARGLVLALLACGCLMLVPYWVWLVLAIWVGLFGRRIIRPLSRLTGGRQRAATLLTAALLIVILLPIGLVGITLVFDAIDLVRRLAASQEVTAMFAQLVAPGPPGADGQAPTPPDANPMELVMSHGMRAWTVVAAVFSIAAEAVLGLFIFISGTYVVLADGARAYRWAELHLPIDSRVLRRFADAFTETGRGLFIGVGGSGLAQAVVATIAYVVLGVADPYVLGLLTLMASVIPSFGTALVWVPVAIGLAVTDKVGAAIALSVVGVAVIGSIDNIVRPILAQRGKLALPSYLIMVSMFGGLALIGASGLILGPLALRLAKEALVMYRESTVPGAA